MGGGLRSARVGLRAAIGVVLVPALVLASTTVAAAIAPRSDGDLLDAPALRHLATGAIIPDSWIVSLRSGDPALVAAEHAGWGVRVRHVLDAVGGYTARMDAVLAARVAADPRVQAVHADRVIRAASQDIPTGVARVGGGGVRTRGIEAVLPVDADVAILDTGIDVDHPDLNVAGGFDCVSTGFSWDDPRGHGTHIAGIVGAKDNAIGVVGVAPGVRLWAVRVLDGAGDGSASTLACGVNWVTRNSATIEVANMSLIGIDYDGGCADGGLHQAVCESVAAGVSYVAAAGNDGADAGDYSPASYDEVITVSALADYDGLPGGLARAPQSCTGGADDEFATFSNFGSVVDLIAPGVCIRSTWPGGAYSTLTGTSQAAAHVAGAAALYRAGRPGASPAQVADVLRRISGQAWAVATDPDGTPEPLLDVGDL